MVQACDSYAHNMYTQDIYQCHVVLHDKTQNDLQCAGIDLNPRFHDCRAYEFTDEVAIFDLLQVPLLHGWLVDPQVRFRVH